MEINIDVNELRKRPLMIATPAYGGMCGTPYMISVIDLISRFTQMQIQTKTCVISNESLITRARNNCVAMFRNQKEFNRLLFIDADIKFAVDDVLSLLALSDEYPVICGSYPKKAVNWQMVAKAVRAGVPDSELQFYIDNPVLNFVPTETGVRRMDLSKPIEVLDTGTGFMMIRQDVFDLMEKAYPELKYTPDYALSNAGFDDHKDKGIFAFFDTRIHADETSLDKQQQGIKRYLSEDYSFCELYRRIGGKIFVCPWIKLTHYGSMEFKGDVQKTMSLQSKEMQEKLAKEKEIEW